MGNNLFKALEIVSKWQKARDSVYWLLTHDDKTEAKWKQEMKDLQVIIGACRTKHKLEVIPAVLHLVRELGDGHGDNIFSLHLLAAGYELVDGRDYTEGLYGDLTGGLNR